MLDSFGVAHPRDNDCGALYQQAAPLRNACLPPEQWQFLDVAFRAPRVDSPGCLTVFHNGVLIHHHVPLSHPTPGALELAPLEPGPILLQDHGDPVRFRNLWVLPA
ncbi:MAG: DUF1080 domain-containing protein [Myxococcota bacterium]|nr:DUF1080 domain-containing protein [Myxococcota bacterium]